MIARPEFHRAEASSMAVPFIDLRRFEPDFLDRWAEKSSHISRNTMFIAGPEAAEVELRLAEQSGAAEVVGCANGTDALQLALRAAGVGPGDTVLIPDNTFWATFEAVVNVGAKPVTVDIDMTDLQMDFDLLKKAAEEYAPKAAILVHLYGWASARLDDYRQFCDEKGIFLVEDGAQCFGVEWKGRSIYQNAKLSTVSFYPAKVLGSCGDAGAVYCGTKELAETVRQLSNHGRSTHYGHTMVGWNSRMGGFDAAYLNLCLDYAGQRIATRRAAAERYRDKLAVLGVKPVGPPEGYLENGYLNVTLHDPAKRPAIQEKLKDAGIGSGVVYPGAMSKQPGAEAWIAGQVGGENAALLSESVLNLPIFAYIKNEEVDEVLGVIAEAVANA
jgi:dTDP-4-amino-4,6-dideoxygalactose transaminase